VTTVRVSIAGSSGSIGTQTLDVVRAENARFAQGLSDIEYVVSGIGLGSNIEVLIAQAREFTPGVVAVADTSRHHEVREALPGVTVVQDMAELVNGADVVINAVVGFAGLPVTLETLRQGKRLGLANKESLIAAGPVVQPLRSVPGAEIVPVDSEHCAVHQCLRSTVRPGVEVSRIVLTASGGPFRGRTLSDLAEVTVQQALAHPTWSMGPKITIDSSTLMNKGLEVIEAHELFGVSYDQIEVVVHPQSVMRLPIGYALAHPNRIGTPFGRIDWSTLTHLDFSAPDISTFRCLSLAYQAGRAGGTAPAFLSAANEIAVEAFLVGSLKWPDIAAVVEASLQKHVATNGTLSSEDIIEADRTGREVAHRVLSQ
jgi:1-deoxy-D-xylulose-5-phosphate reductoisomerase